MNQESAPQNDNTTSPETEGTHPDEMIDQVPDVSKMSAQDDAVCAVCGHHIEQDDLVCPNCGTSLVAG